VEELPPAVFSCRSTRKGQKRRKPQGVNETGEQRVARKKKSSGRKLTGASGENEGLR